MTGRDCIARQPYRVDLKRRTKDRTTPSISRTRPGTHANPGPSTSPHEGATVSPPPEERSIERGTTGASTANHAAAAGGLTPLQIPHASTANHAAAAGGLAGPHAGTTTRLCRSRMHASVLSRPCIGHDPPSGPVVLCSHRWCHASLSHAMANTAGRPSINRRMGPEVHRVATP